MCCLRERSYSKITSRLRVQLVGFMIVPWNVIEVFVSLARCCEVKMMRYSVLDGLTESLFEMSQLWTESRTDDSKVSK